MLLDILALLSDLVSLFLFVFFCVDIVGGRILVCMTYFLDYLAKTWYGIVIYFGMAYWVLSIIFRSFGGCHSCAHL